MTLREAHEIVSAGLRFGDSRSIEAADTIQAIEVLRDFIREHSDDLMNLNGDACDICDGDGTRECNLGHEHDCENCRGEGTKPLEIPTAVDLLSMTPAKAGREMVRLKRALGIVDDQVIAANSAEAPRA